MDAQTIYRIFNAHGSALLLMFLLLCSGCGAQNTSEAVRSYDHQTVPFSLYAPDRSMVLPVELKEISGLTWDDNGNLAAIEDEHGLLYFISASGEILEKKKFSGRGDYEGIEKYNGSFWVIESNGILHRIQPEANDVKSSETETGLGRRNDVEGLAVFRGRLLVACKADGEFKDNRVRGKALYHLDEEQRASKDDYIEIDIRQLKGYVKAHYPEIHFKEFDPSGVAVDPVTSFIYIISADHFLCVLSASGELLEVVPLDKKAFRQPEGICFTPDGDLYISSEADGKDPMLYFFGRK